jgi:hypothetical protein
MMLIFLKTVIPFRLRICPVRQEKAFRLLLVRRPRAPKVINFLCGPAHDVCPLTQRQPVRLSPEPR